MGNCPVKGRSKRTSIDRAAGSTAADAERNLVVSLYNYPCGVTEFTIGLGERLNVISDDGELMMVKSAHTGHESYIPAEYTAKVMNRWLFKGLNRFKAEELLRMPYNHTGAFIVRESQSQRDHYSLSILQRRDLYLGSVKHYRIGRLQNGWFYISPSITFPSLHHLVAHYSDLADGLCCPLQEPCFILGSNSATELPSSMPAALRRPTVNWKDISRSMIFRQTRAESEHSLVSEGLREAISSYLYMTEGNEQDIQTAWDRIAEERD